MDFIRIIRWTGTGFNVTVDLTAILLSTDDITMNMFESIQNLVNPYYFDEFAWKSEKANFIKVWHELE